MEHQEDGEAFFLHRPADRASRRPGGRYGPTSAHTRYRRPDSGGPPAHRSATPMDSGGSSLHRYGSSSDNGGSSNRRPLPQGAQSDTTQRNANSTSTYQPRFKSKGLDKHRNNLCKFCGIEGHFERECNLRSILDRIKDYEHNLLKRRHRNLTGQVHNLEDSPENFEQEPDDLPADQVVEACLVELNLLETPQQKTDWYLDSGATHHVSGDLAVFTEIHPTHGAKVRSAGGHNHSVAGVGNVDILVSSGKIKSLSSVLYTSGITKNLLSVGSLVDQRKTLVFQSRKCFVVDDATLHVEVVAVREHNRGLYKLQSNTLVTHRFDHREPETLSAQAYSLHRDDVQSPTTLWHRRLGHFHTRGMQRMLAANAVRGLPRLRFPTTICTGCQLGKHSRTKIPKQTSHVSTRILELIHLDVCGPFKTTSTGGAR